MIIDINEEKEQLLIKYINKENEKKKNGLIYIVKELHL